MKTIEIAGEIWTQQEIEDRIELLPQKYHGGYMDYNQSSAINVFKAKLKELISTDKA